MDVVSEIVGKAAGLTVEQLALLLAFGALGVAALAIYSIANVAKNKDR
ncbi:hypothetical protein ACQKGL_29730 [Ensifer adhaerens]